MSKPRRKKKRRGSPSVVAKRIASALRGLGIHGKFEIEKFHVEHYPPSGRDTNWSNQFFWLASALPEWIEFRALFSPKYVQDIASLGEIAEAFLRPLIDAGYTGRSIAMARTIIGEGDEAEVDEWRSLTVTNKTRATLQQIEGAVEVWDNRPNYIAATGFAIRIEL